MTTTAAKYETAHRPLMAVLDQIGADDWDHPSPCAGWSARDVVLHMVQTQRDFLTGRGCDLGLTPSVPADPAAAWRDHAGRVLAVVAHDAVASAPFDGHFGPTTVGATLEQFYVWDMVVHRWDVARATGLDAGFSAVELDQVEQGADSFGAALYMEGVCAPGVTPPDNADRQTDLLARLGRRA